MPTDLNDVTQVELLWIEKRIENRIRFGHIIHQTILDGRRRRVSFAPGSIFRLYVGPPMNTVRSSRAFTSYVQSRLANAIQRFLSSSPVARSCSTWHAGRRSRRYFMPSRSLRPWVLIRPMRHRSIGTTFTTGLASTRRLGPTPIHSTRPGLGAKESHCE